MDYTSVTLNRPTQVNVLIARVHNSGNLFQSNACYLFLPGVRIIGVSVVARCPQGEKILVLSKNGRSGAVVAQSEIYNFHVMTGLFLAVVDQRCLAGAICYGSDHCLLNPFWFFRQLCSRRLVTILTQIYFVILGYKSCFELCKADKRTSDVYKINPDNGGAFDVYCDQTTAGGGWTVFQKRLDGSVDFDRDWDDYKRGFGNLSGEFWLGLDKIHRLAKEATKLRVDLEDFSGNTAYAEYNSFGVGNEKSKYKLSLGSYSGRHCEIQNKE